MSRDADAEGDDEYVNMDLLLGGPKAAENEAEGKNQKEVCFVIPASLTFTSLHHLVALFSVFQSKNKRKKKKKRRRAKNRLNEIQESNNVKNEVNDVEAGGVEIELVQFSRVGSSHHVFGA